MVRFLEKRREVSTLRLNNQGEEGAARKASCITFRHKLYDIDR